MESSSRAGDGNLIHPRCHYEGNEKSRKRVSVLFISMK
jgi:hypothetical protein